MPIPFSWTSSPAVWGIVDAMYGQVVLVRSRTVVHLHSAAHPRRRVWREGVSLDNCIEFRDGMDILVKGTAAPGNNNEPLHNRLSEIRQNT